MTDRERTLLMGIRQGLLLLVDVLERYLDMTPRTGDLRKERKRQSREEC